MCASPGKQAEKSHKGTACRKTHDHFLLTSLPRISKFSDRTRSSSPQPFLCFSAPTEQNCHHVLKRDISHQRKAPPGFRDESPLPTSAGLLAFPMYLTGQLFRILMTVLPKKPPFWGLHSS